MKQNFATLAVSALIVCCICNAGCKNNVSPTHPRTDSCAVFCSNYVTDSILQGMITMHTLMEMTDRYKKDKCKSQICPDNVVNDDHNTARITPQPDALSMVFDLKKLQTLIWQMERYACQHNCNPKVKLGVRFYYVKYPADLGTDRADACLSGLRETEKNKHALVMVPVYWNEGKKRWFDYNIWTRALNPGCFPIFSALDSLVGVAAFAREGDPNSGDNHGGVGPPPDPGTFPSSDQ